MGTPGNPWRFHMHYLPCSMPHSLKWEWLCFVKAEEMGKLVADLRINHCPQVSGICELMVPAICALVLA